MVDTDTVAWPASCPSCRCLTHAACACSSSAHCLDVAHGLAGRGLLQPDTPSDRLHKRTHSTRTHCYRCTMNTSVIHSLDFTGICTSTQGQQQDNSRRLLRLDCSETSATRVDAQACHPRGNVEIPPQLSRTTAIHVGITCRLCLLSTLKTCCS